MVASRSDTQNGGLPPGVYVDFVEQRAARLERRTDIAGFAGFAGFARPAEDGDDDKSLVFRCDRLEDFLARFPEPDLQGEACRRHGPDELPDHVPEGFLREAVRGFFANGGRTCWVASVAPCRDQSGRRAALETALKRLGELDEVSLIAVPDAALLEPKAAQGRNDRLGIWEAMILQAEGLRDRVALIDSPRDWRPSHNGEIPRAPSGLGAIYWPWLQVGDSTVDGGRRDVPPSGHIAGTIARRDLSRGVFAPPANLEIEGVVGVTDELLPDERASANEDGINVIVATPGRSVRAMGARTLLAPTTRAEIRKVDAAREGQNADGAARIDPYCWLHVRRLVAHLAEWIEEDTQWTVFEPHGPVLWRAVERTVRTLLFDLWRRGGLTGATDDEAYFVHCDETTNPPEERELGRVTCLVGLRPVPAAEMIVVRIGIAEGRVELIDREVGANA